MYRPCEKSKGFGHERCILLDFLVIFAFQEVAVLSSELFCVRSVKPDNLSVRWRIWKRIRIKGSDFPTALAGCLTSRFTNHGVTT